MTETGLYIGSALQGVDRKGRVAIPADFRQVLERKATQRQILVGFHATLPCLRALDLQWAEETEAGFKRRLEAGEGAEAIAAERELAFGEPEPAPFDPSGRFILPDFARTEVEIDDCAFFLGAGPTFNIWAPKLLMVADSVPDRVRRRCAHLLGQRKGGE